MKTTKKFVFVLISWFAQLIPVFCNTDDLYNSWVQINKNDADDIQQSNKILYRIKEEYRTLAELRTIVERHLRTKNAEILTNGFNSYNFTGNATNLQKILKEFDKNYDKLMIDSIFSIAIEEKMLNTPAPLLPQMLWSIYQQNKNSWLFEIMLRAQLQLYNSFRARRHIDEKEFLYLFANKLQKITQESLYKDIDLSLKSKVQNIIEQLPENLKYLYFMPYFCLQNAKYSTYIYTAIEMKVDPLSRYIWLWRDSSSMDDTGYIKAEASELNTENDKLFVSLKGTKYQMYYYMMTNTMKIAGWDSFEAPLNHIWEIEFLDNDRVAFSQNDYMMCAVENHDNDRRNVAGRKIGEVSSMSPECQWRLGQCIFI